MSFMKQYNQEYFDKIEQKRNEFNLKLNKSNNYYVSDEIELEVGDWFINYHKWQHPSHELFSSSDIFTEYEFKDMEKFIPENSVMLDIGAGAGYYSVAYSLWTDKVISFEPNYGAFNVLRENFKLNDRITAYNVGCSKENKKETFWYRDESLYKSGNSDSLDVYLVNLKDFLYELHSEDIDNIKLIRIGFDDKDGIVTSTLSEIIEKNKPIIIKKGDESEYKEIVK